eukprot:gene12761-16012_t
MYDMLAAYEQKSPTQDQVKHDDLREVLAVFIQELSLGKEFIADHKDNSMDTLKRNVEELKEELMAITSSCSMGDYVDPDADPEVVVTDMEAMLERVKELNKACETYQGYQRLFELDEDDFGQLVQCEKEANDRYNLWKSMFDFMDRSSAWTEDPILDPVTGEVSLHIEEIRTEVDDYAARAYKMGKQNRDDPVVARFKDCIDDFKQIMPLVEELANPALKLRHWEEIFTLIDADIPPNDDGTGFAPFFVRMLLQYNILDKMEQIQTVSSYASKEYSLEKVLEKMELDWEGVEFKIADYKDTGTFIMGGADEVQAILDDQIVKTQSMMASPFIKPLEAKARRWETLMTTLQEILDNWLTCQGTWQYLEPIFSSPDILKQMPEEGEKFQIVDQAWRDVMESANASPSCLVIAADKEKLVALEENNKLLDEIQKGLAAYLELKRIAFPRFFFLSNDEMLEILSETKDPTRVQPHLKKCFEGIDKLRFEPNADITGTFTKIRPADANGSVEKWLVQVEMGMVESIRNVCKEGVVAYVTTDRNQWVLEWPGQVVLVITAVFWTKQVTECLEAGLKGALQVVADSSTAQLTSVVNLVRGNLTKLNRATLSALVVMDVHARDVTVQLAKEGIEGEPGHFSWLSQLRMYWEDLHEDPENFTAVGAMRKQCVIMNLQPTEYFFMKTIQLYEMIVVRHGLMTVGQPFSGKTCALKVLAGALTDLHDTGVKGTLFNRIQVRSINPKSVTMGQLYGENDKATQEWKDGVLAINFRSLASDPSEDRKWMVLDGPVDAIWIENMNTVLDDNKKLCLPNSEIIQMSPTMSMIFEVGDLAAASPATVSRCGMVYLEPHQLGWKPLLTSWINILPSCLNPRLREHLEKLFDWLLPASLRFLRKEMKEISPTEDISLAQSVMRLMTSQMDDFYPVGEGEEVKPAPGASMDETSKIQLLEGAFLFAMIWSVGATTDGEGRTKFDEFFRNMCMGVVPDFYKIWVPEKKPNLVVQPIPYDDGKSTVYDYKFDQVSMDWVTWTSTIDVKLDLPVDTQFSEIIIPTKDSARYTYLLDLALTHNQPLLMVGPTGTGKSVYINRHLADGLPKEKWTPIFITMSARTTGNMTQEQVDGRLDKRRKGVFGPPMGRRAVIFVDDLNMPSKETYGAQPPIELLRQFMDFQGWYGRDNVWRSMVDVQFVAAMGPPGGGRTFITNRYVRHFNTLALSNVSEDTLVGIFSTILDWHLASRPGFPQTVKATSPSLIAATLDVYKQSMAKLLPTPTKSHYVFNLRDFARVVQGVMMLPSTELPSAPEEATALFKRLWVHEVFRVFYDQWLVDQLKETCLRYLSLPFDSLMAHLVPEGEEGRTMTHTDMRRCFFGDYMDEAAEEPHMRKYSEVTDVEKLLAAMEDYRGDGNSSSSGGGGY